MNSKTLGDFPIGGVVGECGGSTGFGGGEEGGSSGGGGA
eukprot:COSAG02_NODE_43593_length_373_cov_0.919708_2_plen_38_part_01